jgi:hypothetical protein
VARASLERSPGHTLNENRSKKLKDEKRTKELKRRIWIRNPNKSIGRREMREIFGINLYILICFLLTISIVGIVLKKIL